MTRHGWKDGDDGDSVVEQGGRYVWNGGGDSDSAEQGGRGKNTGATAERDAISRLLSYRKCGWLALITGLAALARQPFGYIALAPHTLPT